MCREKHASEIEAKLEMLQSGPVPGMKERERRALIRQLLRGEMAHTDSEGEGEDDATVGAGGGTDKGATTAAAPAAASLVEGDDSGGAGAPSSGVGGGVGVAAGAALPSEPTREPAAAISASLPT